MCIARINKRLIPLFLLSALVSVSAWSRANRLHLFPQVKAGQSFRYLIRYRADKQVKTRSNMDAPMAPSPAQLDARGLLVLEILDVQPAGPKSTLHARAHFENSMSTDPPASTGAIPLDPHNDSANAELKFVEFTILPDGRVEQVNGLDALPLDQQHSWQEWISLFAVAGVFPANGVRQSEKWNAQVAENVPSPIAGLLWEKESTYVKDAPCGSALPNEICAVILTRAILKQKSSRKNATPEDFMLHQLRTVGTARGTNETITYISLKTGLVVRATEEAAQLMDATIAKSDGSNQVRYNIDAKSHAEILLLSDPPPIP